MSRVVARRPPVSPPVDYFALLDQRGVADARRELIALLERRVGQLRAIWRTRDLDRVSPADRRRAARGETDAPQAMVRQIQCPHCHGDIALALNTKAWVVTGPVVNYKTEFAPPMTPEQKRQRWMERLPAEQRDFLAVLGSHEVTTAFEQVCRDKGLSSPPQNPEKSLLGWFANAIKRTVPEPMRLALSRLHGSTRIEVWGDAFAYGIVANGHLVGFLPYAAVSGFFEGKAQSRYQHVTARPVYAELKRLYRERFVSP